jgi:hypothetical protein
MLRLIGSGTIGLFSFRFFVHFGRKVGAGMPLLRWLIGGGRFSLIGELNDPSVKQTKVDTIRLAMILGSVLVKSQSSSNFFP